MDPNRVKRKRPHPLVLSGCGTFEDKNNDFLWYEIFSNHGFGYNSELIFQSNLF